MEDSKKEGKNSWIYLFEFIGSINLITISHTEEEAEAVEEEVATIIPGEAVIRILSIINDYYT